MNDELKKYDIIDTFDENKYQTVLMGIDNSNYQDIVIINKLYKSESITTDFIENYKKIADNVLSVFEIDNEITVINQYEQASLLSDYLIESSLDLEERIRLGKSFLYQLSNFSSLNLGMQMVFIQNDQLTIKNGVLKFSNYIFLKDFQAETTQLDLFREIGKSLELILQLHREKLTSELSTLQQFIYQLLNSNDIDYTYNDLYNQFKVVAANLKEDTVLYSPTIDEPQNTDAIIEAYKQVRTPKEVIASITEEVESNLEESVEEGIIEEESNEILQFLHELEEDITLVEDDVTIIEENIENEETIRYDFDEIEETDDEILIESLEDEIEEISVPSDEILDNAFEQLSKFGDDDLDDLLNVSDFEIKDIPKDETIDPEIIPQNLDELIQVSLDSDSSCDDEEIKISESPYENIQETADESFAEPLEDVIKDSLVPSEEIPNNTLGQPSKLSDEDLDNLLEATDLEIKDHSQEESNDSELESQNLDELNQLFTEYKSPYDDLKDTADESFNESVEEVSPDGLVPSEEILNNPLNQSSKFSDEDLDDLLNNTDLDIKETLQEPNDSEYKPSIDDAEIKIDDSLFEATAIEASINEDITIDNQTMFHDEKHHSIHLNSESDDPIQEILDRNDKQYSDLYVSNTKTRKKFLPTFLLFFIILIIITSLLIFYSSTYM